MKISALDFYTVDYGDLDLKDLKSSADLTFYTLEDRPYVTDLIGESEGILVNKIEITEDVLNKCQRLKYIGTCATGYNNIDIEACRKRGITVCNVPAYSTEDVCQLVFALLLTYMSKTDKYSKAVADGEWVKCPIFCYVPWVTHEISGKTFGIVGYGSIGKRVAAVADAFGMHVLVSSRTKPKECPYEYVDLDELYRCCDIITLHCPLTSQNTKMIDASALSIMKEGAILINTARGGLVDENAVADALKRGHISAFLADTLSTEPPKKDNPLLHAPNTLITPHIAWTAYEARVRLVNTITKNIKAYIGGNPINVVS